MRVALHSAGEVGRRTGRILLAERSLQALGLYGHTGRVAGRKVIAIRSLEGYDPLVTDDTGDAASFARIAAEEGVSCVLASRPAVDDDLAVEFARRGITLLVGADLAGVAETLATHERARDPQAQSITVAWTVAGSPLRRGPAVPFPDPVGARWGRELKRPRKEPRRDPVATNRIEVPVDGIWAGAMARVRGSTDRVVGVADQADHLAALALAAGAVTVAEGAFAPGMWMPADAAEAFLAAAVRVGMDVAAYSA